MKKEMKIAHDEAKKGMQKNEGGPFGCVIVKNGTIVGRGHNTVIGDKDPTCHAEINAIRSACKKLKRFDLSDCELYTTCEPCPMCLSAIYWARIKKVYYACDRKDAKKIGFSDKHIYDVLSGKHVKKEVKMIQVDKKEMKDLLIEWKNKEDKVCY